MVKKISAGTAALALAAALVSCSSGEEIDEVDVNGFTVSAACEKVREAGWNVDQVRGRGDASEISDCTDSERKVVDSWFKTSSTPGSVTLYFANEPAEPEEAVEETPVEEAPVEETPVEEAPVEEAPVEEAPVEEASTGEAAGGYQAIYDEYSARLQNECPYPVYGGMRGALSNEGVSKMAQYMYKAKGTDGQYATYETWAGKLMDVYMDSAVI